MTSDVVRWTKNDATDYGVSNIIGGNKFGHQRLNNNNKKLIRNNNNNNNCKNINTNTDSSTNKNNNNNNNNQYYYNRDHRDNVKSFLIKMRSHFVKEILVIISILMRRNLIIAFCKLLAVFILFIQLSLLLSNNIFVIVAADNEWISNIDQNQYSSIERSTSLPDYDSHTNGHFTPTWAVHIPNGDTGLADRVAEDHGFINLGKIVDDHYHFHHNSVAKRSVGPSDHHQSRLLDDDRVRWSEQQRVKSRKKRDFIRMRPSRTSSQAMSLVNSIQLNDVKWPQMWYLNRGNGLDMNVIPAWKEGITGKGVVVTILDDGLESTHPDLEHNYDPKASYDVNSHDEDPMPHYDMTDSNRHGTRCAGEVAATANNTHCAVGIAFGASVGGVRMLDGDVTDAVEARSLSLNPQHIDIYSASWGPDDDGKTVDGPGEMATHAFIDGVTKGRNGKGSIFVWASGNGGRELDNCNCDGYTNSIWTLSISSATEEGHVPWYSEKCSSTLATTYSSGGQNEKQVVTTDLHHSCTASHTGTSASAPLAAGIVALVLEANQNLTWRDLQHIVVRTAKPGNLKDNTWSKNGVGRRVSHSFGYGLMDAAAMVRTARTWKTVPEQQRCEVNAPHMDKVILPKDHITLQLNVKHCTSVNFLEHVQAKITLTSQRRGDIQIYLKSPAGTKVTLLTSRIHDVSRSGFNQWPFMSVHTWGEAPHGNWQLEIHNEGRFMGHASLKGWSLIFYGTAIPIDKNDPISVSIRPAMAGNLTSSSNHHQVYSAEYPIISQTNGNQYPITVMNKPNSKVNIGSQGLGGVGPGGSAGGIGSSGGGNGGRKQQQQQQHHQVATYGIITSMKKNKNSKNNNASGSGAGGGNKSNGKNFGNNQKASTNRPNYQSTVSQFGGGSRNNFYRISTAPSKSVTNTMKTSDSTQRPPKLSQQLGGGTLGNANKSEKLSRIHEKIAIKAPKQVKDSVAAAMSTPSTQSHQRYNSFERIQTQNPRIPKLFEQYEKIQQIFPEFHPYTGPKETLSASSSSSSSSSSLTFSSSLSNQPKPPPNKKQYPYYESPGNINRNLPGSSSLMSSGRNSGGIGLDNYDGGDDGEILLGNGPSGIATNPKPSRENTKKMSPNFQNEDIEQQQLKHGRIYIPNRKNTKAQITQWDMIFHGTEQPAQPDDPYNVKVGRFGSYPSDMEHNLLDFDPETASGQWRNMQQVGESQVDVQRKSSNDLTKSSCLNMSPDQRCIECVQTTFLYDGRCFSSCPNQTYMVPEKPHSASFSNPEDSEDDGPLRRRRSLSNFYNLDDVLPQERAIMRPIPQKLCAACDSTCLRCRGPGIADCIKCHSGWTLVVLSADESYCKPSTITGNNLSRATNSLFGGSSSRSDGSYDDDEDGIGNDLYMFLIIIVPALTIIILVVIMSSFGKRAACPCSARPNQAYDRIAFSAPDDDPDGDGDIEADEGRFQNIPDESIRNIPGGSGHSIKHPQLNVRSNLISAEDSGSE